MQIDGGVSHCELVPIQHARDGGAGLVVFEQERTRTCAPVHHDLLECPQRIVFGRCSPARGQRGGQAPGGDGAIEQRRDGGARVIGGARWQTRIAHDGSGQRMDRSDCAPDRRGDAVAGGDMGSIDLIARKQINDERTRVTKTSFSEHGRHAEAQTRTRASCQRTKCEGLGREFAGRIGINGSAHRDLRAVFEQRHSRIESSSRALRQRTSGDYHGAGQGLRHRRG